MPQSKEVLKDGLQQMLKLLQTFEKIGFATDPYLGNLTASPKHLGTALTMEATIGFEYNLDHQLDKDVNSEIEYGKHIKITDRLKSSTKDVVLKTEQTLAPNYNEVT